MTGAGGFIAGHLIPHLEAAGDDVVEWSGEIGTPDITDRDAMIDALAGVELDGVYHLAAQSLVDLSWDEPARTMVVNGAGTVNLLDAIHRTSSTPPRVLILSSAEVYGIVAEAELPVVEGLPLAPRSPYGVSKAAGEQAATVFGGARDIDVLICRPFNLIGPGQQPTFVTSAFAKHIVANERNGGRDLVVGNLSATRDFLDVRDAVAAFRSVLVDGRPGEAYNVCSGRETSIHTILETLVGLSSADHDVVIDAGRFRPNDLPRMFGSSGKIRTATGWAPERTLDESLSAVLEDWRRRSAGAPA